AEVAPAPVPGPADAATAEPPPPVRAKPATTARKGPAAPEAAVEIVAATGAAAAPAADEPVNPPSPLDDSGLATRASAAEASGDYLQAAADRTELLRRHPRDNDARRALVFALQQAGLPERALAVAEVAPDLFSAAELAALHGDVADQAIALAVRGEPRADRNRVLRERAVATIDRACNYAETNNLETAQNRCSGQRVVYLSGIGLHQTAVDTYAPASNKVDDAAHTAAAKSLLELTATRRGAADEADEAWARRSQAAAADHAFAIDRLFAREQLRDASKAIDARIAQTPTHLKSADGSVVRPNWDRVVLESEKMRALAWRGKIREAIAGQQALVAAAPADTDQRLQLADFYRQNGQRDLADAEMRKAGALEPDSRTLLAARIDQAIDDGEFQDSRRDLKTLRATWPADDAIAALDRRHDLATTPRIEASVSSTRSDGPGTINASDELWQEATFYGHAWERRGDTRLFVFEQGEVGEYATETSNPLRVGLGMMTRHRDWDARFSVHGRRGTPEDATGATLAGHVRFNDHWEADATLQSESTATPMLALENGIDAWSVDVGLQYNVRAGHYYRLDAQELGLDDDNRSLAFALSGRQPLYADQPHQWALLERIETSASDELAVPYFSPERMSAAEVQLEYRGVLLAGGTLRWEHVVTLGVGASEQTGFGSDTIGDVRWEHLWAPGDRLELGAGIEWRRRAYDGDTEDQREFFASLLWRLP
ncbi:MAG: hypothetical protein ACLGHJ_07815, partial [Gammaproteobacteria bacterium]